jgi:uncharacterized PurR-regulated membrane protein YhhQ (DUF165 family)
MNKTFFFQKMQAGSRFRHYVCTITYILLIVLVNFLFEHLPYISFQGHPISIADFIVGVVYVMRDFSQREIRHYVIPAMLVGCFLSYILASKQIATASVLAFFIGEFIDWGIYTFTRKPLSQRLLWSSLVSTPIDSAVFLYAIGKFNWVGLLVLTLSKMAGALALWGYWRAKRQVVFDYPPVIKPVHTTNFRQDLSSDA